MSDSDLQLEASTPRQRVRLRYARGEAVKFISHQDEFRLWERTLRRAGLPLLYKQGFNPQPHMQFAAPLGVGFTGVAERLDIVLSRPLPPNELAARIRAALPPGVVLHDVEEVPLKAEALQSLVIGADYTILIYAAPGELDPAALAAAVDAFLAEATVWRVRERKGEPYTYNLRPLVLELAYRGYDAAGEEHHIFLRVQQRPGATGRPDEVVTALGLDNFARTLRRDRLYFAGDADDVACFAAYPLVTQEEIAGPPPRGYRRRGHVAPVRPAVAGRTISERAGDEFD
jgi:radical SAM-linked protein